MENEPKNEAISRKTEPEMENDKNRDYTAKPMDIAQPEAYEIYLQLTYISSQQC